MNVRWRPMLVGILAAVVLAVGSLWLLQRRLIYLPSGTAPAVASVLPGWVDVELPTADGLVLGGWYHEPPAGAPVVIVFNGNAGNREGRAPLGLRLAGAGYGVLLFDYRGYGGNPGRPTESGLAIDARAAAAFVEAASPGRAVFYFGESLGAAVAIGLATELAPAGLILRSPFASLADAAAVHYPFLPVRALLWDEYPSVARIPTLAVPLLVVIGDADSIVPPEQSRALFDAATGPKRLVVAPGADHNDLVLLSGDLLIDAVIDFIVRHGAR